MRIFLENFHSFPTFDPCPRGGGWRPKFGGQKNFRQIQEYCLAGGSWSTVGPLASALQEGPKPYSCLPNQQRGSPSWKRSTRHSWKASQPYSLTVLLVFQKFCGRLDIADVSRILFRERELTEFCAKLGEFCDRLGEFALAHTC